MKDFVAIFSYLVIAYVGGIMANVGLFYGSTPGKTADATEQNQATFL